MLPVRIELTASPLPRECSTTELRQRSPPAGVPMGISGALRRRGPIDSGSSRDCNPNLDAGPPGHYIGRIMGGPNRKPGAGKPDRAERLAEALRENLRKRKAQLRSRVRSRARHSGAGIAENRPENDTETGEEH